MQSSTQDLARQCLQDSFSGTTHFGQIVAALHAAGVESYYADYRNASTTYYQGDAALPLPHPQPHKHTLAQAFDPVALQEAIRGAQRGEVKYPEFLRRSMAAGCIGYMVWIEGGHVAYYGRRGEVHVERFPS